MTITSLTGSISISFLRGDEKILSSIADMYYNEWKIDRNATIERLGKRIGIKIPFVLVAYKADMPIGVVALDKEVNLFSVYPEYKRYSPWLSLLYVLPEYRNKGIGSLLCNKLEAEAFRRGVTKMYLYTETALSLYKKLGWKEMERKPYKSAETVLMYKEM